MPCPFSPEDISAYTDGELGEAGQEKLKQHLQHCAPCANIAESFAALSQTLRSRPVPALSHSLADRVAAAVAGRPEPRPLSCKAALEAASAYLDAELPPSQAERLEAHLLGCADCAGQLELLRLCVPAPAEQLVPVGLHQRILAAVAQERRGPVARLAEALALPRWLDLKPARVLAPAVAFALAAVLAWTTILPRLVPKASTTLAYRPVLSVKGTLAPVPPEIGPKAGETKAPEVERRAAHRRAPAAVPGSAPKAATGVTVSEATARLTDIFAAEVAPRPDPGLRARLLGEQTPDNANSVSSGPVAVAGLPPEPHITPVAPPGAGEHDRLTPDVGGGDIWAPSTG